MTDKMFKEVDAPEHYKAAKDKKIRIKDTGKVQKRTVTDERIPVVPDTPQTGINGKTAGMAVSLISLLLALGCFACVRAKDKSKYNFKQDKEFFNKHRKIYFTTDKKREYEVFAVMSVNIHEFEYWKFVMARNKEEHDEFIDKVEKHSLWRQENKPKYGEQMLMLSTCDNGKGDDCRIVVIGKNI